MSANKPQESLPKSIQRRQIKVGKWNESLVKSDVNQIWAELHRIVSSHPLVRASKRAGFLVEEGKHNAYTDLTQELFVALLSKERFQHYLDTGMKDLEIEAEISQIDTDEYADRRTSQTLSRILQSSAAHFDFDSNQQSL